MTGRVAKVLGAQTLKPKNIAKQWQRILIGQDHAIEEIMPYLNRYLVNLHLEGKTAGNIFLVGPTGTGKTKTPESLAEVLHGSDRHLLRIDCGSYVSDHEVSKLIGSPPGYLGHRETQPLLGQGRLSACTSDKCRLSIVVFDEVEKAASSLWRCILSIMDKAELTLGDNTKVSFENTLLFFTSNLGADKMRKMLSNNFGYVPSTTNADQQTASLEEIGAKSVERGFSPEFFNRIDATITYQPLNTQQLKQIAKLELKKMATHIITRLGENAFYLSVEESAIDHLTVIGNDPKYGARYLKRAIEKQLFNPLCFAYLSDRIIPGASVKIVMNDGALDWEIEDIEVDEEDDGVLAEVAPTNAEPNGL